MPQQSRASRRQHARGDGPAPKHRDPMVPIYIAVGVLLAVIIAGFGGLRWYQYQKIVAAYATPTPAPSAGPTSKPIPIADGQVVGAPKMFASETKNGSDTATGGHGQPVHGITCGGMEYNTLHIHSHLAIFINGKQVAIPRYVGGTATPAGGCLYWIHTHSNDGIIHVEAPQVQAPEGGPYTLGMFFDIWGQPLDRGNVAGFKGPVTAFVNGLPYEGDLRAIELKSHQIITLEVGKTVPPPNYLLPPND